MKLFKYALLPVMLISGCGNAPGTEDGGNREDICVVVPQEDTESVLKNPCTGWGIYEENGNRLLNPAAYWNRQDKAAREYATFLYIRWHWSDMEPEEGKYAWIYNENYKALVKGALDRGLKLCFRVIYDSQDNWLQTTPQYVRDAGAEGYMSDAQGQKLWSPYPDDKVFQEKLEKFIEAFAAQYDDPQTVDFIDGTNMGWWGENHHLTFKDSGNKQAVFEWITSAYGNAFKKVLLTHTFGSEFGWSMEKAIAIDKKGYTMRRDGLGSQWFTPAEQAITAQMWGKTAIFGEQCWWGGNYTTNYHPYKDDAVYKLESWLDTYKLTLSHALQGHFNTLDLRQPTETKGWLDQAEDLVQRFTREGGYRFYPAHVAFPEIFTEGETVSIEHQWINRGAGYLPNNNPRWNYKYKPAFALVDLSGQVSHVYVDESAEPSEWLSGKRHICTCRLRPDGVKPGEYTLALAIVDTTLDNKPAIELAVTEKSVADGWTPLKKIIVE